MILNNNNYQIISTNQIECVMKRLFYLLSFLLLSVGMTFAQTTRVTGKVISSEDGEPVVGATIVVKGTTTGTITNYDGQFTLDVPSSAKTLVVSTSV